jgi:cyanophycinase
VSSEPGERHELPAHEQAVVAAAPQQADVDGDRPGARRRRERGSLTAWKATARMGPVFLIGGGRDDDAVRASHGGFVRAAGGGAIVAIILDEGGHTDPRRWTGALALAGAAAAHAVVVSAHRPPAPEQVAGAAGIYVAGGWTPGYADALVAAGAGWLPCDVPYAGFSAGAALAAGPAILGGWRRDGRAVCPEDAGEDLDAVTVLPGLGLVPFAVDVHASQWGTLGRAVDVVRAGEAPEAVAVDEGTVLVAEPGGGLRSAGLGAAHRVRRDREGGGVTVELVPA